MSLDRFGRLRPPAESLVAAVAVDGDFAQLVVVSDRPPAGRPTLVLDSATTVDDLTRLLAETANILTLQHRGAAVRWVALLAGESVHHEIVQVPPQIRAFQGARLDASLATTRWGNLDAIDASGYRLAHAFDGDRCLIGVAPMSHLDMANRVLPGPGVGVSAAAGLLALFRMVNEDYFDATSEPVMGLLCESTGMAACIIERGQVRLLFQTGLLEHFSEIQAPRTVDRSAFADSPLEFEFGGAYSIPTASKIGSPIDLVAADIESEVYQATTVRVIQEVLRLYAEQYGTLSETPQLLMLTGDSVTRHALRAYLGRQLGAQFEVDEIDAALAVRIDEPGEARRIAASQNSLGGALCALAAGLRPDSLTFDLESANADSLPAYDRRVVRTPRFSRAAVAGIATAVLLFAAVSIARLAWASHVSTSLSTALHAERERQTHLKLITDERNQMEARLVHTRAVLAELDRLRGRQSLPPELLSAIQSHVPFDTTLDEVSLANGVVRIVGSTEKRERGAEFALSLEQLRDTFADVTPQVETVVSRTSATDPAAEAAPETYRFTISARYVREPAEPTRVLEVAL